MRLASSHLSRLFILLFVSYSAAAQEGVYKNFSVDDGLPSSEVYDIYQDKSGYIWFATDKGLSRYNGYEFSNYNSGDGLPGNAVLRFYPQQNGQIWCYTLHQQSLFYFDEEFNGFKAFPYNALLHKNISKLSIVKSVYVDESENIHIGGYLINGEIIISPSGELTRHFASKDFYEDSLISKKIILKPTDHAAASTFYFMTSSRRHPGLDQFPVQKEHLGGGRLIIKWQVKNETAIIANRNNVTLLSPGQEDITITTNYSPTGITPIDKDHFFVGYEYGGGKIFDTKGNLVRSFLEGQSVTSLLIDHEGGYWFSTLNSGIFYLKNPSINVYDNDEARKQEVKSLTKTKDGVLVIGYENGTMTEVAKNRSQIKSYKPNSTVHALVEYDDQLDQLYTYKDGELSGGSNNMLFEGYILKISEPKGQAPILSSAAAFFTQSANEWLRRPTPYRTLDVCLWANDTIIATPVGIYRYDNNEVCQLDNHSPLFEFRSDDIDINGNTLYAATQGAGLVIINEMGIESLDMTDGLSSNIINEVYVENDSTIWACTIGGLDRIIWGENGIRISSIGKEDGLLSNEIKDIEIVNDTVWVGTKQGLCYFPKRDLVPGSIAVPDILIKHVLINDAPYDNENSPHIQYKEDQISLILEGISYAHNEDVFYKYRLNKSDKWSITRNRKIQFSSLAWGNYLFEGQMCIDDQNCTSNIVTYQFTIRPPIWARWWFISLCLLALAGLVYSFFKIRVLTYNKDVTRELIRLIIKWLKRDEDYFSFRENGNDIRIKTKDILYVKSAGNYIDLHTLRKTHTIRLNIGKFLDNIPDKLEYVQLHRSYIVRIDKIVGKSTNEVELSNGVKIPVSQNHQKKLKGVVF